MSRFLERWKWIWLLMWAGKSGHVHSLVLTDIATGWTEAAPLVVREGTLVVETLERIRVGLPFPLRALDVDKGTEFVNEKLIEYCLGHGIELTRSRPYRKNDRAWIEQKNGAVVRKPLGYRRFEGLAAARAITRLYAASRLFVNFFQPSFKLAAKQRDGAKVTKRYHPPQTPCDRLLQADSLQTATKTALNEVAANLDPLKLLEEMRAVQAYLTVLSDGEAPPAEASEPPNLAAFVAGLSTAWHAGELRPTFSFEAKPRYLRGLEKMSHSPSVASSASVPQSATAALPTQPKLNCQGGRSRYTPSLATLAYWRCAWHGRSHVVDWRSIRKSAPSNFLRNCAPNFLDALHANNTKPSFAALVIGEQRLVPEASRLGQRHIEDTAINREGAVLKSSRSLGTKWPNV
jgi:hypothetical protein